VSTRPRLVRAQRLTIVNGILVFVVLIVVLQLWLLTATMNAYLGGDSSVVLPAALASLVCLGLNGGLLWYLARLD
jgi:F0F1-type ATP synthase assembly protein I